MNILANRSPETTCEPHSFTRAQSPGHSLRILLIDDEESIRQIYAETLGRHGYQVDTAEDGESGWQMIEAAGRDSDRYGLLITDNNMPKLSGFELVKRVRSAHLALPVIMASGMANVTLSEIKSLGLDAILSKPFFPNELINTVKTVLRGA
jgi:two-component system OmpR family response regulator